jgi:hypothetical protein
LISAEVVDFLIRVQNAGGRLKGIAGEMAKAHLLVACTDNPGPTRTENDSDDYLPENHLLTTPARTSM